jgi:hypothetical protein
MPTWNVRRRARLSQLFETHIPPKPRANTATYVDAWLANAATTIHPFDLNPTTAAIAKSVITIDSKNTV